MLTSYTCYLERDYFYRIELILECEYEIQRSNVNKRLIY